MLVSTVYPFDNKKDMRFGTSSTIIRFEQFFAQTPFNEIKARPQLFIWLHDPGCLNSLNGGNCTLLTNCANGPFGIKLIVTIFL